MNTSLAFGLLAFLVADPPLSDRARFPDKEAVRLEVAALHNKLECLQLANNANANFAIHRLMPAVKAYDCLLEADLPNATEQERRRALGRLREVLHPIAYYVGWLPP
jgi:hypothetical protein